MTDLGSSNSALGSQYLNHLGHDNTLTLPPAVQEQLDKKRKVKASYLFEVAVSVRGKPWQLHRRTANENSAIFRQFDELFPETAGKGSPRALNPAASPVLFNAFLDMSQSQTRTTVAFAIDLCVRVPGYEVDGALFLKDHFEGGYLFRDTVMLEATPPAAAGEDWSFEYWFANQRERGREHAKIVEKANGAMTFEIPIEQPHPPGIKARLQVKTSHWNQWHS